MNSQKLYDLRGRPWLIWLPAALHKLETQSTSCTIYGGCGAYLMALQGIFSCEGFPATSIAEIRLFASMRLPVPLEIVLAIKRQGAQIACKGTRRRGRVLRWRRSRRRCQRDLRGILR